MWALNERLVSFFIHSLWKTCGRGIAAAPLHIYSVYRSVGGFGSGVCSVLWNIAFEGCVDGSSLLVVLLVEGVFRTVLVGG